VLLDANHLKKMILDIGKAILDVVQSISIWFRLQNVMNFLPINIMQMANSVIGVTFLKANVFQLIWFPPRSIINFQLMKITLMGSSCIGLDFHVTLSGFEPSLRFSGRRSSFWQSAGPASFLTEPLRLTIQKVTSS
jgi:hypothetical protein